MINVGDLDEKIQQLVRKKAKRKRGDIYVDLTKLGCWRLLGGGKVTHPLSLKAAYHSKSAEGKIEDTNGKILEGT